MSDEVPQAVLDYLATGKLVTLATAASDGTPHASTFMYVNEGTDLYIWARPNSTTAGHLQDNPKVSFAIDEYVEDFNKAKGIQGTGTGAPVPAGDGIARAAMLFGEKYPSPTSGSSTTSIAFFKIETSKLTYIDNEGERIDFGEDEFGFAFKQNGPYDAS